MKLQFSLVIKLVITAIAPVIFFSGCMPTRCADTNITPVFVGFSASDIDTLIIRKYQKDNTFLHLLDTTVVTSATNAPSYYVTSGDTTVVIPNVISEGPRYILPDNDWQIYIPAINKTVSISGINSTQTEKRGVRGCSNPITSFTQDGQTVIPGVRTIPYYGDGYVLYVKP